MPNTFKSYYFPVSSDEEANDRLTIIQPETKHLKRAGSNNSINKFFDEAKPKKPRNSQSSTVGRAQKGGMSYISTNINNAASATHLIKLEVYELKKLAKLPASKHWKQADIRAKFYTKTSDRIYERSKQLIYDIVKDVAESEDCKKYFFHDEA